MWNKNKKIFITLIALIVVTFSCLIGANAIQTSNGNVEIINGSFSNELGNVTYKIYKPVTATKENPAPGVLLLHGYQNDKDTGDAYAIELSRRGVVVLAIDEYGHGLTDISMINRGYTDHKVTTNYGLDSEEDGTYKKISGANRYKVMMNFSNLTFFNDKYSKGSDGSEIKDSSMGGKDAYDFLTHLNYVDGTKCGITGHSMGTWASWSTAAAHSNDGEYKPKATILQAGELFTKDAYDAENITFNNVLLLTAKYDEFNYFRDYQNTVSDDLVNSDLRKEFLGLQSSDKAEWDTTYGKFEDGTARRCERVFTNHRLLTHDNTALTVALDWFDNALNINATTGNTIPNSNHIYMFKEWLLLIATLCAIATMVPIMMLLLQIPFFGYVSYSPIDTQYRKPDASKKFWKGAIITCLIGGLTYPFMTQLGHGLLPLPESIFRMTIGNGFLSWYLLLILVMLGTTIYSWKKSKKQENPMTFYDLGIARPDNDTKFDWMLLGKSALVALIMIVYMYIVVFVAHLAFSLDLRFIWPFFRPFTGTRLLQFLVYLPIFALFFVLNNSKIFSNMRQVKVYETGWKSFVDTWWRNALCMVGGVLIIVLIEYIPFFLELGPGADLLFSTTFGGPFMSLLLVFVPQVLVFSVIGTVIYRKTGNVYISGFVIAMMACWIVTGGSAML